MLLAQAQESDQVLDEEQLVFLADPGITDCHDIQPTIIHSAAFQTGDIDAYDSDCDDISSAKAVLMAIGSMAYKIDELIWNPSGVERGGSNKATTLGREPSGIEQAVTLPRTEKSDTRGIEQEGSN
ncbi:hypothetical protein Tco_0276005 [Tanacetum coccineum]